MQARGWPEGEAHVELDLVPSEQAVTRGRRIVIWEDATQGPGTLVPRPLRQLVITPRSIEILRRLAYLTERPCG